MNRRIAHGMSKRQTGITLVEVLISLVLGLLLVGAATGIYLSNRQTFRQVENLARLQENARIAFELMGRDIREAGGIVCGSGLAVVNQLGVNTATPANWWANWGEGVRGYTGAAGDGFPAYATGTAARERVQGTQSLLLWNGSTDSSIGTTNIGISPVVVAAGHGFENNDVVMACDLRSAALVQITNAAATALTVNAVPAGSAAPGDTLTRLQASAWYVGYNGRGGTSLYRVSQNKGATTSEEMIENVTNLKLAYLVQGALQYADPGNGDALPADWTQVVAVRVTPTYTTAETVGTNNQVIQKDMPFVVKIRNREYAP
jgi:type IV pilus assembly protein PilW